MANSTALNLLSLSMNLPSIAQRLADELQVRLAQVQAVIDLMDAGSTVPFIARYRKEATGGLDDVVLRALEERLGYLRELDERRRVILQSIQSQGKLSPELEQSLLNATTKQAIEDLYLPYKPKRRTKGQIAREAGLEPLALALWGNPELDPQQQAQAYVLADKTPDGDDFTTVAAVLDGARDILCEIWSEDAEVLHGLREWMWQEGWLRSRLASGLNPEDPQAAKCRDYHDYAEPIRQVPSHRALAVFRARSQDILDVKLMMSNEDDKASHELATGRLAQALQWQHQQRAADDWLSRCIAWAWRIKFALSLERELMQRLRDSAEIKAIQVFGENVRDLLLAAPAGAKTVMGLDPGIRTGVKVAVVDVTGKVVETATVYPFEPRMDREGSLRSLVRLVMQHGVQILAIGNGTASRETDMLAAEVQKRVRESVGASALSLDRVVVSEAGASVYSASEMATSELPDLDVSLRGAVSIARRLQDPLAELVKIDPKSIGVGQYQHDVNPSALAQKLDSVVEDCVNKVGVDLNTASVPLLTRVSGLNASVARSIVRWRDTHGAFKSRRQLLDVSGLGPKAFEQAAGFLRIRDGDEPLDQTGVHPESYPIVEKIIQTTGKGVRELMGSNDWQKGLKAETFVTEHQGVITVKDIWSELEKPGRDPRGAWVAARFNEGVHEISDLRVGMVLQGTVSNVAQFGAFVDLGVHQDGLVHVSQMARHFVADAKDVVKAGDVVRVQVLEVDVPRQRISLSMIIGDAKILQKQGQQMPKQTQKSMPSKGAAQPSTTSMAAAFAKLKR